MVKEMVLTDPPELEAAEALIAALDISRPAMTSTTAATRIAVREARTQGKLSPHRTAGPGHRNSLRPAGR